MNVILSTNNNKNIVKLPYVAADGLTIDYGSSNAENFDSAKYGQIKVLGADPLASVSISGSFLAYSTKYAKGTYSTPFSYIKWMKDNRKNRIPMRLVITDNKKREIFNRLMNLESLSWSVDKVGNINYSAEFEQYRKV